MKGSTLLRAEQALENCNFVKTVLMITIILYHSMAFWLPNGWFCQMPVEASWIIGTIAKWLNSFHVYGFVLVSGYIFYALKYENGRYQEYLPFLKNKFCRLIVPYIFTSVVWVIPIYLFYYNVGLNSIISKYVLAESPSQLWFLVMLFDVFALFWPISDFSRTHSCTGAFLVIVLYIIGLVGARLFPNIFQIWTALSFVIFFYLGFVLRKNGIDYLMKVPVALYLSVDIVLFGLQILFDAQGDPISRFLSFGMKQLLHLFGALSSFVVLEKFALHYGTRIPLFEFCKKHSMVLYLFHQQIIYFVISVGNGRIPNIVLIAANFLVAFFGASVIAVFASQFRLTRFLTTGRTK